MDWKALLKEFREKLAEAIKDKTGDERAKLIAAATDALPQEARQHLHDLGHADNAKEAEKAKKAAEAEAEKAKKAAEAKDAEIAKLKEQLAEKQPEVAKVKEDYEQRLVEKDNEVRAAKEQAAKDLAEERRSNASRQLEAALSTRVLTDAIARGLANDPELQKRLVVDEDGTLKAYQADGKTPLAVTSGQTAVDALVADVVGSLDKSVLKSTAASGSGASGTGDGSADDFEAIRTEVKSQYGGSADDARKRLDALS